MIKLLYGTLRPCLIAWIYLGSMMCVITAHANPVGSDQGNIEITADGQAVYTLPLTVPPGVLGLAPKLTLSVSGQGQLNLGGLSAISRCTGIFADHGQVKPVRLLKSDEYCLDGSPLVLISGNQGEAGSVYHTRMESFQKIEAVGAKGQGPDYFKVTTRTGGHLYFGQSPASQTTRGSDSTVIAWSISAIVDPSGNGLWYEYENVSTTATPEVLLQSIVYGSKAQSSAPVRVDFIYEHRPDFSVGYALAQSVKNTKRLAQINTRADDLIARKFKIVYEQVPFGGSSRVKQIYECAENDQCYRPSEFNYASVNTSWTQTSFNQPSALQDNQGRARGLVLDINNDGYQDWVIAVQPEGNPVELQTWLGSEAGWAGDVDYALPGVLFHYAWNPEGIPLGSLIDANGDGLVDYIQAYSKSDGTSVKKLWLNTGSGFTLSNWAIPDYAIFIQSDYSVTGLNRFADVNGDGLTDMMGATRLSNGDTRVATYLNQGSDPVPQAGWALSTSYRSPVYFLDYQNQSQHGVGQGELIDINNDGLLDIVVSAKTTSGTVQSVHLNTGQDWKNNSQYKLPIPLVDYSAFEKGIPNAELADINGDGLIDLWQAIRLPDGTSLKKAWLNNGGRFVLSSSYTPTWHSTLINANGHVNQLAVMQDINGDGKPEQVHSYLSTSGNFIQRVIVKSGSTWVRDDNLLSYVPPAPFFQHFNTQSSSATVLFADLDADAQSEVFVSSYHSHVGQRVWTLNQTSVAPGYITEHINGLGVATRIEYGVSSEIPADVNSTAFYTASEQTSYPVVAVNDPMVLVKTVKKMSGLVRPSLAQDNNETAGWFKVDHFYGGLKASIDGRGSLGFKTRKILDKRQGGVSITSEFYQGYPFTGMSRKSEQTLGAVLLSSTETPQVLNKTLYNAKTVFVYAPETIAKTYDPISRDLISTTTTHTIFDDFGNIKSKTQTIEGQGQSFENHTDTTYENRVEGSEWLVGLPIQTSITHKALGQNDITNTTTATYNNEGYPKTEILQPLHAQSVKTTYVYDEFGNVKVTNLSSGGEIRKTTTVYTDDGRFPIRSFNPLNHRTAVTIDSRWGKPVQQINANNLKKLIDYDAFGTVLNEDVLWEGSSQRQAREIARPYWCETGTTFNTHCPNNAVYFVAALDDQSEPAQAVYYDAYGRELLKQTSGADLDGNTSSVGGAVYVKTVYDSQGRKIKTSRPGTDRTSLVYDEIKYDTYGRVKERITSDGATTVSYNGLTTTTTNAKSQSTSITNDLRGKPTRSIDAMGSITNFEYDAKGNLTKTIDALQNAIVLSYDIFDRKISMNDPDMGYWEYRYDGFGNLIWQKDANLNETELSYDTLNRLVSREEVEGTTTWVYDTAPRSKQTIDANGQITYQDMGYAKGLLAYVTGPDYTRSHRYDQAGRPIQEVSTVKGKSYTSARGYYRASQKIAWERYPSGLILTKEYDPSGYPMKLESGDLDKYQAYLSEYYAYEDLTYQIHQLEQENQSELDKFREILLGEKLDEKDSEGNPKYAGGGLDDQVKPYSEAIGQVISSAQNWQNYLREAGTAYNEHAKWSQDYYSEYQWYLGKRDENIGISENYDKKSDEEYHWGDEDRTAAVNFERQRQDEINKIKNALHAACKATGSAIYSKYAGEIKDSCTKGFPTEDGKRVFGLGSNQSQSVCWRFGMSASSEQGGYETCKEYRNVFKWLPTNYRNITVQEGYKEVCVPGGGGGGADVGNDYELTVRSMTNMVLDLFVQRSYALQCHYEPNLKQKTVKVLKPINEGTVTSRYEDAEGFAENADAKAKKAEEYAGKAQKHYDDGALYNRKASEFATKANTFVNGVNIYGAISSNHGLITSLIWDSEAETGRYVGYKNQVEHYTGVWQCKRINQIAGEFINGTNPTTAQQQLIDDYDNPNVGPFKPSVIPGAQLVSWDSDNDGKNEKWYINETTKKMAPAEKAPIYKRNNCKDDELYVQISTGELGKELNKLHNSSPYFQRNYVYYQYKLVADPINTLVEQANTKHKEIKSIKTEYDNSGSTYWEALSYSPDGQIKRARLGNGVISNWGYDSRGRTTRVDAKKGSNEIQRILFAYDALGNLKSRNDVENKLLETFGYDQLNRLKTSTMGNVAASEYATLGLETQSFDYDVLGNLTYKSDVGTLDYLSGNSSQCQSGQTGGIHAVKSTSGDINTAFCYDANGNQIQGHDRTLVYSSYNKPLEIIKNGAINKFKYGPERQLIHQIEDTGSTSRETRYVGGNFEETTKEGKTQSVHHLTMAGHTIAVLKTNDDLSQVNSLHYFHQDHLDSVVMITDDVGNVIEKNHYDAFGKKRLAIVDVASQPIYAAGILPITDRSFTGHRYLPEQELIHMKGRVYDPTFGRFLSADPHIQSPLNGQSLNRYSYVMNNPLSLTDPSGYFFSWFKKLFKKILRTIKRIIKKIIKVIKKVIKAIENVIQKIVLALPVEIRIIAAIVVAVYAPQIAGALSSALGGTATALGSFFAGKIGIGLVGGFLSGLISTGSFKGALIGGLTGAAFGGVHSFFGNPSGVAAKFNLVKSVGHFASKGVAQLTNFGHSVKTLAHGVVGGLSSKLSGGSFSKSFLSTAFVQAFAPGINKLGGSMTNRSLGSVGLRTGAAALLGGVAQKLVGGSFSMGARLGAMSRFFNDEGGVVTLKNFGRKMMDWIDNKIDILGVRPGAAIGARVGPFRLGAEIGTTTKDGNKYLGLEAGPFEVGMEYNPRTGYSQPHYDFDMGVTYDNQTLTIDVSVKPLISAIDSRLNLDVPNIEVDSRYEDNLSP